MNAKDKIIVALDCGNIDIAERTAKGLSPYVGAVKVGLELLSGSGSPQVVERLKGSGVKVFFDGKFKDIPNTVAGAARAVTRLGVWMFNVHALGGRKMMEAAINAADSVARPAGMTRPLVIAVTVLTSLDVSTLAEIGLPIKTDDDLENFVVNLAKLTKSSGLDGVVASPKEIGAIRKACGSDFKIVTPGIRPVWAPAGDQKRITTPEEAIRLGADYIVIGRPITNPPVEIGSPIDAAKKIVCDISK